MPVLPVGLWRFGGSLLGGQVDGKRLKLTIGPGCPGLLDPLVVLGEVQATVGVRRPQLLRDPFPIGVRSPHPASRVLVVHDANYNTVTLSEH
jgi:hypothetical protein